MARYSRLKVLNTMVESGLVPVFYNADVDVAIKVVEACAAGGSRLVEFTNRGDLAYKVFCTLVKHVEDADLDVMLGVGSVIDGPTAGLYVASGANFVVSPILNPEMARVCNRHKVAWSPGCATPSEISQAEELGAEIIKVFPGKSVGGPPFVKALLGPCPWTSIMPTGGVDATKESIDGWFGAGVTCVGMGSRLIRKDLVAAGDYEGITENVRQVLAWIKEARNQAQ